MLVLLKNGEVIDAWELGLLDYVKYADTVEELADAYSYVDDDWDQQYHVYTCDYYGIEDAKDNLIAGDIKDLFLMVRTDNGLRNFARYDETVEDWVNI